ncbi:GNAT family N-acetyltransferase [Oceanihabitans sp. 2_MG-2023]|uniref:GNAT family N-acetyltransferase n=1 Tax=Oceanihabitans sp. 2_MG-2023 TaxID=3062661 RepID=UPI0026E42049|nr:GNAT family N-acetyltransferase [Oceanihabitans sp. 2_MG-2023]MDO6596312.1 GNAT family N-acetyltransferase [Oceanihabitans sp. 2_MG-2023]
MKFKEVKAIETPRLTLHILNGDDVDIVFALRSNVEVIQYIVREPLKNISEGEEKTQELVKYIENNESISWVISLTSEKIKIGSICLWNFSEDRKTAEVGYDLLPEYHKLGIMNEALKAVLCFGFSTLKLNTVEAYTSKYNKGSIALLKKNDFKQCQDRKDEGFPDNIIFNLKI